ncbi:translation elongation factor 4 [Candidatus Zinderia endosymbiont of Aphrophora alni]|uniref:translation elongation factor 4 n=1 Tax=Candidatus Zinderia endosymbiont of Aphrophora alni TaxID=3077951 RepID=UPI0030D0B2F0
MKNIRNFSIIAHIDHGKSTLADRIIEFCNISMKKNSLNQVLDSMDIEKERGITIKAQTVFLKYKALNNKIYNFNLIDTPGHTDFNYEVNKSLSACEGALLIIDASQGIEAQTISNYYMALDLKIKIIPILNKIDLLYLNLDLIKKEIEKILNIKSEKFIHCSAKTGFGIRNILETIVLEIPAPNGNLSFPLQALIFDSWFNKYVGVIILVRIFNGILNLKDKILLMSTNSIYTVINLGIFLPNSKNCLKLTAGNVGFIIANIKNLNSAKIGDTITLLNNKTNKQLPGFKKIQHQVFSNFFPIDINQYSIAKESLKKLQLNDSSFKYKSTFSKILGLGFRCGFLGLFHMEIIQERLMREFNINLIITAPTVLYKIIKKDNSIIKIDDPTKIPNILLIKYIMEPIALVNLYIPKKYIGLIIKLCFEKRGIQKNIIYYNKYVELIYEIPMSEIIFNFINIIKSITNGYASMNYKFKKYKKSDIVKVDILINKNIIDPLSIMVHRSKSYLLANKIIKKIQKIMLKQMFEISIQASIGKKIILKKNIKALRKNVISKCYGGDITRKHKLLEKQKIGKKKMKKIGLIKIPQEVFLSILKIN